LWNLLTNALKFTPKGGSVQVVSERVESSVAIQVRDSGVGIAADFLPHVFDRFRQANASSTRHHSGLGLGLAIVKNLVELHGGTIRVESPGLNQGSTFTITLPIVVALESTAEPRNVRPDNTAASHQTGADLSGLRILIVDDEVDAREMVKRILSDRGAAVETAPSSGEALKLFPLVRPHVFITDIGMPGEDGYEAIRRVRELSLQEGGAVPAIALTAFARAEDRERAIASGFQTHLAKPVEPTELIATVANLAGRATGALAHPEFEYD
jgi:CheY-like chemotaxis protein